jgi:hypothetical protein
LIEWYRRVLKEGLQNLGGFARGFWGLDMVYKKGFTTPQRVYKSDGKEKEALAFRGVLVRLGGLEGVEGLHCFNGTYGLEAAIPPR